MGQTAALNELPKGEPLRLAGSPLCRGRAQAGPEVTGSVIQAIALRLRERERALRRPGIRDYLDRQWDFAVTHCGEEFAEMLGVAQGFNLDPRDLFAFLHLGIVADLEQQQEISQEGCSAWAISTSEEGPALGKNRDFRGEHAGLQRVFLHSDPAWPDRRKVLCVGSLGAPGAYSSGINSDGLALADTAVATTDHGVGWLRYFLMTRLLARHATVAAALDDLRGLPHAGGGSLVLADAGGTLASVDLGHSKIRVESGGGVVGAGSWVARTNHFAPGSVAGAPDSADSSAESEGRLATLHAVLGSGRQSLIVLRQVMASHDSQAAAGLCRHAEGGRSRTLSSAVFACRARLLYFSPGNPCETEWLHYAVA